MYNGIITFRDFVFDIFIMLSQISFDAVVDVYDLYPLGESGGGDSEEDEGRNLNDKIKNGIREVYKV